MELLNLIWQNINWLAATISIIGIILNAKKLIICWPVWILSNILWIAYSLPKQDYAYVVLWIVFIFANFFGWQEWRRKTA